MGLFLVGMILLLVWLWFAVQEPDCEALRRRPAREYVKRDPSQPPPSMGEEPTISFEKYGIAWEVGRWRNGYLDHQYGDEDEIRVYDGIVN